MNAVQREFLSRQEGVCAPAKEISEIIAHFGKAAEVLRGASEDDFFELKEIVHHQKQDMQCLCGRSIKHMYVVSHVALNVELGLGSECFKYFFTDLTAAKMKQKLEAFEGFCLEIEEAIDLGFHVDDSETLGFKEWKVLSAKQLRRLEFGLPLTQKERNLLDERIVTLKSFLNKEKKELAHKLLKAYKEFADHGSFQYVMGLLDDGTPIRSLEDLKAIPMETLQKLIEIHMGELVRYREVETAMRHELEREKFQMEQEALAAKDAHMAQLAQRAYNGNINQVEEVLVAVTAKRLSLSPRTQDNLSTLLDNLDKAKKLNHDNYVNLLLSTDTRLSLSNMVNQLGLPYSLLS